MIKDNSDNRIAVLQLEALYSSISFCMTSVEKIESNILDAQIVNAKLEKENSDLKREIKTLNKKVEDLLERIEL
jgi:cell division protein FtsB